MLTDPAVYKARAERLERERDEARTERDALREALERLVRISDDRENHVPVDECDLDFGTRQAWHAAADIAREALAAPEEE